MNITDICFLVFTLFFTVVGIYKGFIKTIINLLSGIIAFVVAVLLANPIAYALGDMALFDSSKEKIRNFFLDHATNVSESMSTVVAKLDLPAFIKNAVLKDMTNPSAAIGSGVDELSKKVFMLMLTAVIFIIIMVLIRIVFIILEKSIEAIFKKVKIFNATNRILGGVLGFVNAFFITYIILAILALTSASFPNAVNSVSESLLVSKLYFHNLLLQLLA